MAHELEITNGEARMFATKPAWHNLGTIVDGAKTAGEAIALAKMDTTAELQEIFIQGSALVDDIPVIGTKIEGKKAVVREDGNILGVVGNDYHIIQNVDCFDFMDDLIGSGHAVYETAGSLRNGSRIFMTCKLPEAMNIGPDKIDKYLLLSSSHDGSLSLQVRWTPVRVVCQNTLSMAMRGASNCVNIRHTRSYKDKIQQARQLLELTEVYYNNMEVEFNKLLDESMTASDFTAFSKALFPDTLTAEDGSSEASGQAKRRRSDIENLYINGMGHEDIAGTRWAAFNAVTEYVDHHKVNRVRAGRNKDDVRMESTQWGSGSLLKQKAFNMLVA